LNISEDTPTVLVDARNVLRSEWPNIPEDELVERCCRWGAEHGKPMVVVFDGPAPGGLIGGLDVDDQCVVVGTGKQESADDWLIRRAAGFKPYWLVTSDRALRDIAGRDAERTIGGGGFARELRRQR
jgi:predicted RNA-binding protein with PIN domain